MPASGNGLPGEVAQQGAVLLQLQETRPRPCDMTILERRKLRHRKNICYRYIFSLVIKILPAVNVGMYSFNKDIVRCELTFVANLSSLVESFLIYGLDVEPLCSSY